MNDKIIEIYGFVTAHNKQLNIIEKQQHELSALSRNTQEVLIKLNESFKYLNNELDEVKNTIFEFSNMKKKRANTIFNYTIQYLISGILSGVFAWLLLEFNLNVW